MRILKYKKISSGKYQITLDDNRELSNEEVVKLDREYIESWNIGLDFKILLKTFLVVFKRDGSK